MIKIAIVDDHQLFNEGLNSLLTSIVEFEVVGKFNNGKQFLADLPEADVVLLDINMPGMNGFETLESARKLNPQLRIILLSMHNDYTSIDMGLKLGVNGFLQKDTDKIELQLAIETVVSGENYFSKEVTSTIMKGHQSPNMHTPVKLTPRETEILKLIAEELTTQEIADKIFVSTNTVETHRKNLIAKTGSKNSVGLVKFALENKLI